MAPRSSSKEKKGAAGSRSDAVAPGKRESYIEARGGRKTARARARIFAQGTGIEVNGKACREYFKTAKQQTAAEAALKVLALSGSVRATVRVSGGGTNAQAEAVRNALAKALAEWNPELKKRLRQEGFLTRDARMVERKKYGLKKARRAPQWQKR